MSGTNVPCKPRFFVSLLKLIVRFLKLVEKNKDRDYLNYTQLVSAQAIPPYHALQDAQPDGIFPYT